LNSGLWYTRTAAASALGRMGLPVAAAPLVALLKDPNRTVRDAGRDALVLVCGNEMGRFEVAVAFRELPERARQLALDGLAARNPEIAERVAALMHDPSLPDQADRRPLARAVGEDGLRWGDVVGDEGAEQETG